MKTAWVLSGGGAAGCIEAGAMTAFAERGAIPDAIYGTSAGALNSYGFSHVGATGLRELWHSIDSESDVFSKPIWPPLPWRTGYKKADPLRALLSKNTFHPTVPFKVCSLNLKTGEKVYTPHDHPDILNMTVSSASMEGYIEPYVCERGVFADGGAVENVPLKQAIQDGAEFIFVFLCFPFQEKFTDEWKPEGILGVLKRTYKCRSLELFREDIRHCKRKNKTGRHRHVHVRVIAPDREILDVLDFNSNKIREGFAEGYRLGSL